jgi:hypothetical protein
MFLGPSGVLAGEIGWNLAYQMSWSGPIFLSWFAERLWGSANYNIIQAAASPVTIPVDCVMYVMVDPDTDGQSLTPIVVNGASLPHGDNVFVIASHKDIGLTPNNPLTLRNGVSIPIGTYWAQTMGLTNGWWGGDFNAQIWNCTHNLASTDVDVVIQDANNPRSQIWPEKIEMIDVNNVRITFGEIVSGRALVHLAGKVITVPSVPSFYFKDLLDCPPSYATHANKVVTVKPAEDGLDFTVLTPPVLSFIGLSDVPVTYVGQLGKMLVVNQTETAVEFVPGPPPVVIGEAFKYLRVNSGATGLEWYAPTYA